MNKAIFVNQNKIAGGNFMQRGFAAINPV